MEGYDIKYITVHKSKGLEADNTIILNLRNHILGFPNKMNDDPMLSLLLSDYEEYRFAEERRLFYVALTRTKNKVILMLPIDASLFAEEIIIDNDLIFSTNNDKLSKFSGDQFPAIRINKNNWCRNHPLKIGVHSSGH